ncbi:sphingomyelinase-like phosphodiesterase 3a [Wickerhamomyces ciferrii]|uniref:Sphingomyelinase-like phosphodiesterase 3a n=1 Tax=Wickerhamomyces ciferrii (strain ATCC 14091 / BCRC 22168 / CBS 111 / JCM 3599 / NBRC 0793 / NRRL Y-1031 F-60-10) TaxID=1206466 RepID=K0KVH2_WICCF|nr:sphingomyelinase-like phosphodiesterase 3a [Wickerhamomyces ciferrii]CCH45922.1 sphingomyelinase-like phosphodiesterase 3a [Wickerhamomyces ciferrii]
MKLSILGSFVALAAAVNALPSLLSEEETAELKVQLENQYAHTEFSQQDSELIDVFAKQLNQITQYNGTNQSKCDRCVERLQLGKAIALTKPQLVSPVFTQWCLDTKFKKTESLCKTTFGRLTVANDSLGSNFAHMLQLMDPAGYDGQLYCHFQESKACPLPETPEMDLSHLWPAKESKHEIAPEPSNETYNVLHLSDFHIQEEYQIGSEANCSQYMCCGPRSFNENPLPEGFNSTADFSEDEISKLSYFNAWYDDDYNLIKGDEVDAFANESIRVPAYTFGHYKCDSPEVLINNSLLSIAKYQEELGLDFEFSIFTGDLVDHDEPEFININQTIKSEEMSFRDVKAILKDIPMYAVLGNHDTFPYAQMAQKKSGFGNLFDWNAELMADLWEDYGWINSTQARYAREHYAGFAVTTKSNLKVISLNSNTWYPSNLYAYWNATDFDSFGQFQFLIDELIESEKNDQRVWIIAHIPTITQALPVQAEAYKQIITRFSPYTIAGIFYGHTHSDQFNVLYAGNDVSDKKEEDALQNTWISQAITPLTTNNPSWRYYSVDKKTHSIMNAYNYYTKLNETFTNNSDEPQWEFEYNPRDSYGIEWPETSPLNATFWHRVSESIYKSNDTRQTYINYMKRLSPYIPTCSETNQCDNTYCYVSNFVLEDYNRCIEELGITFTGYI